MCDSTLATGGRAPFLTLCAFLLFLAATHSISAAQTPTATPSLAPNTIVFVPYDRAGGPRLDDGQSVLVPYAEFLKLRATAAVTSGTRELKPVAALVEGSYRGTLVDKVARLDAEFHIEVIARAGERVVVDLPLEGVAIESVAIEGPAASFAPLPGGRGMQVRAQGGGARIVRMKLAAPLTATGGGQSLDLKRIPLAASGTLRLQVAGGLEPQDGTAFTPVSREKAKDGSTALVASLGLQDHATIGLRTRIEAATTSESRLTVEQDIRARLTGTSTSIQATLKVRRLAGSPTTLAVSAPPRLRILGISGPFVRKWEQRPKGAGAIVTLGSEQWDSMDLAVEADCPTSNSAALDFPGLHIEGAVRDTGSLSLLPGEGVTLWPEEVSGLDIASTPNPAERAYRFAQPGWRLQVSARPIAARVRARSLMLYDVRENMTALHARLDLSTVGRGIFEVRLQAPDGFDLPEAGPPELVSGFRQQGKAIEVNLRGEQRAPFALRLDLQRPRSGIGERVTLLPMPVVGAEFDEGEVVLAAPLNLKATESRQTGLEAIDVRTLGERLTALVPEGTMPLLGYRFLSTGFSAVADIERQRPRLTAEVFSLATITPSLLHLDATINYTVDFSATDEFRVQVPSRAGDDVRFEGADIKEKIRVPAAQGDEMTTWTVRLQRSVLGSYTLNVSVDQPIPAADAGKAQKIEVPRIIAANVSRQTGWVAVSRNENLEARVSRTGSLETRDTRELPPRLAGSSLGFRTFDPAHATLELEIVRHELEGVLGALVRRLHIDTVLSNQREAVHEAFFEVQNNREQYLELKLPKGMDVWSAFVRGVPVRPVTRATDDARLIELPKSQDKDSSFRVRLILRETLPGGAMGWRDTLHFNPPECLNMPVLRSTRRLYLPTDYKYMDFGGTMVFEKGGPSWIEPAAQSLLNDIPASIAGGVARPELRPALQSQGLDYSTAETQQETAAHAQASGLDIPVVREGLQYQFSRLSGTGTITVGYWKRKPLLVLQGAVALVTMALLLGVSLKRKSALPPVLGVLATLVAASLFEGFGGRISATMLAASTAALLSSLVVGAFRHVRSAIRTPEPGPHLREEAPGTRWRDRVPDNKPEPIVEGTPPPEDPSAPAPPERRTSEPDSAGEDTHPPASS